MKRLLMTLALTCAFACSVSAGDIPSDGSPAPGDMPTSGTPAPADGPSDGRSELSSEALSALLSVLSFLAA
jgi:hypothetical protein